MLISDIYGMEIITNTGKRVGTVQDIMVDFEIGGLSNLLLVKLDDISRAENIKSEIIKQSIAYKNVKTVGDRTIIVSGMVATPANK